MTRNHRTLVAALAVALGSASERTAAQAPTEQARLLPTAASYTFLIGSGFLCEPGDTSLCPVSVRGASGDSYEMDGAGMLDTQRKSVNATGTYSHKSPNGNVLETGVWIATELLAFDSYGAASVAALHQVLAFGHSPFGLKRLPMFSGPIPTGGLAVLRVKLWPTQGSPKIAVLQVNCALGDVPRERSVEGIRLALDGMNAEFSDEAGGRVMFLSLRPEASPPRAQQQTTAPETSNTPHN